MKNKNKLNKLSGVAVKISKAKTITPKQILKQLRVNNMYKTIICFSLGTLSLVLAINLFFNIDKPFRVNEMIPDVILLLIGISLLCYAIYSVVRFSKMKHQIINCNFTVRTSRVIDTYSEHHIDSDIDWDDYYIKLAHMPDIWVKAPEPVRRQTICHALYLPKQNKPFLIYVGACKFNKSIT